MLTVYRASAGSGKTHLLTGTYLNLLFTEGTDFTNILAVTFTNKATEEMKARIISELNVLFTDTTSSDYYNDISEKFGLNEQQIRDKAGSILIRILHDYSNFNVSTIDKFFQQTIRAFTREIGLQSGYQIELDTTKVRVAAVDRMISELDMPENKEILTWLIDFAQDKMESQKDWNPRKELISLSLEIEKEQYKHNSEKIREFTSDNKNIYSFLRDMKDIITEFEEYIIALSKDALDMISNYGMLCSDFTGGARSPFFQLEKWQKKRFDQPTKTFIKLGDGVESWYKKTEKKDKIATIEGIANAGLMSKIRDIISHFDTFYTLYNSAKASAGNIYAFAILSNIDRYIRLYARENNLMLISDTTDLLNKIIDGKDTPFVYEKIGSHLQHFMIDEFQDTSGMQWENFMPLIDDSMAHGFDNLIVGDVKQSIYRWRNSDWNLLHSKLRDYHTGERTDNILDTNWRSAKNVIDFNNSFFIQAASVLQDKYNGSLDETSLSDLQKKPYLSTITDAYYDTYQFVPEKKKDIKGHVKVEFIESKNNEEYNEIACEKTKEALISLQNSGYKLKDIAILVRNKKEGAQIADYLLSLKNDESLNDYRFDVISNEALIISNAPIINLAVSMMRYIYNPDSELNKMFVGINLLFNNLNNENENEEQSVNLEKAMLSWFGKDAAAISLFNDEIIEKRTELRNNNLYDMVEKIFAYIIRDNNKSDLIFAQAFQDLVLDFINSGSADLSAFLSWWDESGVNKTISTPESQDAIRILTIHKSKGLGFRAVIIPYANWSIDHDKPNIIWCEPDREPFSKIPLIPVSYNKDLVNTIYINEYMTEKRQAFIDNLNLAYVAFTRAKEELIIFAKTPAKNGEISTIAHLLNAVTTSDYLHSDISSMMDGRNKEFIRMSDFYKSDDMTFEMDSWWPTTYKEESKDNTFVIDTFNSVNPDSRLQLRLHGKGYFNDKSARLYGNMMHDLLSAIKTAGDVQPAVNELVFSGAIDLEEGIQMSERILKLISQPDTAQWFSKDANVINETEILVSEGNFLRPDRVVIYEDHVDVIDYKFGNLERKKYIRQVSTYMKLMKEMGYNNINGYLWYVELDKIEKV